MLEFEKSFDFERLLTGSDGSVLTFSKDTFDRFTQEHIGEIFT